MYDVSERTMIVPQLARLMGVDEDVIWRVIKQLQVPVHPL
jgi:predicted DNA-binding transcriptional regulator AlpA